MSRHHHSTKTSERFIKARVMLGIVGFGMILLPAIATLSAGRLHYANPWGAAIFAPFGIFIGVLALVFAFRGFPKGLRGE